MPRRRRGLGGGGRFRHIGGAWWHDSTVRRGRSSGEHERGNLESALELYERALQVNERDVRIHKNLAAVRTALADSTRG